MHIPYWSQQISRAITLAKKVKSRTGSLLPRQIHIPNFKPIPKKYREKSEKLSKRTDEQTDRQTWRKPEAPSGFTGRGLIIPSFPVKINTLLCLFFNRKPLQELWPPYSSDFEEYQILKADFNPYDSPLRRGLRRKECLFWSDYVPKLKQELQKGVY